MPLTHFPSTRLFLAALVALSPVAAAASEALTFQRVIENASSAHPDLNAARERLRITNFNRKAAAAPFLPQVSVGASYDRSGADPEGPGIVPADDDYDVSATARQNLYAGGRDTALYRRRQAEQSVAAADLNATRAAVSFDVKAAFARLLFSQSQATLSRSIDKRRADNVRLVGLRYEAGREHKGSYLRSRANAHQARFEVSQADRALRVAQRELLRSMGESEFDVVTATGALAVALPAALPDFRALATEVPAVRSAQANLVAAETDVAFARSQLLPGFDASASAGRGGGEWPPRDDRWSAGLSLSLPIFQGGSGVYGLKAARAATARSQEQTRSVIDETALDLESTFASFADAAEGADVQAEFLAAAEVRAEIARSQYTSGLLSFEDWDLIESDLITAQKNHLSSLRDAVVAEADWERAQGKGAVQ